MGGWTTRLHGPLACRIRYVPNLFHDLCLIRVRETIEEHLEQDSMSYKVQVSFPNTRASRPYESRWLNYHQLGLIYYCKDWLGVIFV